MTWFEAQESAKFISELETALDDWRYDHARLRAELAELTRIENRVKSAFKQKVDDPDFAGLADEFLSRARRCRHEIRERLMV